LTLTGGMGVNLLHRVAREDCGRLVRVSFGEFLARGEERRGDGATGRAGDAGMGRRGDRKGKRRRAGRESGPAESQSIYWGRFLALRAGLEKYRYLEGDAPTMPGLTAAARRTEN